MGADLDDVDILAAMKKMCIRDRYRNNYNEQVKAYNKCVRQFPNSFVLGIMGYAPIETQYTDYDAPEDAPTDLFGE